MDLISDLSVFRSHSRPDSFTLTFTSLLDGCCYGQPPPIKHVVFFLCNSWGKDFINLKKKSLLHHHHHHHLSLLTSFCRHCGISSLQYLLAAHCYIIGRHRAHVSSRFPRPCWLKSSTETKLTDCVVLHTAATRCRLSGHKVDKWSGASRLALLQMIPLSVRSSSQQILLLWQ